MKTTIFLSLAVCVCAPSGWSQERLGWLWNASTVAVAGASIADTHSSWGRYELNPVLRGSSGTFGGRAVALKSAVVAGGMLTQWLLLRHHPRGRVYAAFGNFAMAGALGAVAARNYGLGPRPSSPSYLKSTPSLKE